MASTNTQDAYVKALSLQDALCLASSTVNCCFIFCRVIDIRSLQTATRRLAELWRHYSHTEGGSLLSKLGADDLKDLVRIICNLKKKKGDTHSKHSSSKKKMLESNLRVTPLSMKYFTPAINKDEEET